MTELEGSMATATSSVVEMILRDHHLLRAEIEVLKEGKLSGTDMRRTLMRFTRTRRAHTAAEEGSLLSALESFRPLRVRLLETMDEHDLADSLQEQIDELLRHTPDWSETLQAKTKVLAETVELHLDEEERLIAVGQTLLAPEELDQLRGPYARLRRSILEQSEEHAHTPPPPARPAWADAMKEMHRGH